MTSSPFVPPHRLAAFGLTQPPLTPSTPSTPPAPAPEPNANTMATTVYQALPTAQQDEFKRLAAQGTLADTKGDDNHTLLYYLHKLVTTPRAAGLNPKTTLAETVDWLANPNDVNQDNAVTTQAERTALWQAAQDPALPTGWATQHTVDDISAKDAYNCGPASILSRMAEEQPKELARLIEEASSPALLATEVVQASDVKPSRTAAGAGVWANLPPTAQAQAVLQAANSQATPLSPTAFKVSLPVPVSGLQRAVLAQRHPTPFAGRGVEALLYSLLVHNGSHHTYDAATDERWGYLQNLSLVTNASFLNDDLKVNLINVLNNTGNPKLAKVRALAMLAATPTVDKAQGKALIDSLFATENKGLYADEEILMQSILDDDVNWRNVEVQQLGNDPNTSNGSVLLGYKRSFEQTTHDILQTLWQGHAPVVGINFMDDEGYVRGGHIIKIGGYQVDPANHELWLLVSDSQDTHKGYVPKRASELIPMIHHMGLPDAIADNAETQIAANGPYAILLPDASDAQHFTLPSLWHDPNQPNPFTSPSTPPSVTP